MAASAPPLLSKIVVTGSILAFHTAGAQALVIYGFSGEVPITSNSASATDGIRVGDEYDDWTRGINTLIAQQTDLMCTEFTENDDIATYWINFMQDPDSNEPRVKVTTENPGEWEVDDEERFFSAPMNASLAVHLMDQSLKEFGYRMPVTMNLRSDLELYWISFVHKMKGSDEWSSKWDMSMKFIYGSWVLKRCNVVDDFCVQKTLDLQRQVQVETKGRAYYHRNKAALVSNEYMNLETRLANLNVH